MLKEKNKYKYKIIEEVLSLLYKWLRMQDNNKSFDYKQDIEKYLPYLEKYIIEAEGVRCFGYNEDLEKLCDKGLKVKKRKYYSYYNKEDMFVDEDDIIDTIFPNSEYDFILVEERKDKFLYVQQFLNDIKRFKSKLNYDYEKMIDYIFIHYREEMEMFSLSEIEDINPERIYTKLEGFENYEEGYNSYSTYKLLNYENIKYEYGENSDTLIDYSKINILNV